MTEAGSPYHWHYLTVDGVISAIPATVEEITKKDKAIILIGPTGSGKSSFIEALVSRSPEGPLGIAKDQLDSVTQHVSIYRLCNVRDADGNRIYIIDTPGLADPMISELRVLNAIKGWRDKCNNLDAVRVLYLHPITDIRMPASKKKCMEILKSFWGGYNIKTMTCVTTMWDCLKSGAIEKAEQRFRDIESTAHWTNWGDVEDINSPCFIFSNTFESAMDIVNSASGSAAREGIDFSKVNGYGNINPETGVLLAEQTLRERIENLHRQLQSIEEELNDPAVQANEELKSILLINRISKFEALETFDEELKSFNLQLHKT